MDVCLGVCVCHDCDGGDAYGQTNRPYPVIRWRATPFPLPLISITIPAFSVVTASDLRLRRSGVE